MTSNHKEAFSDEIEFWKEKLGDPKKSDQAKTMIAYFENRRRMIDDLCKKTIELSSSPKQMVCYGPSHFSSNRSRNSSYCCKCLIL